MPVPARRARRRPREQPRRRRAGPRLLTRAPAMSAVRIDVLKRRLQAEDVPARADNQRARNGEPHDHQHRGRPRGRSARRARHQVGGRCRCQPDGAGDVLDRRLQLPPHPAGRRRAAERGRRARRAPGRARAAGPGPAAGAGTSIGGQATNRAVVLDFTRHLDALVRLDAPQRRHTWNRGWCSTGCAVRPRCTGSLSARIRPRTAGARWAG